MWPARRGTARAAVAAVACGAQASSLGVRGFRLRRAVRLACAAACAGAAAADGLGADDEGPVVVAPRRPGAPRHDAAGLLCRVLRLAGATSGEDGHGRSRLALSVGSLPQPAAAGRRTPAHLYPAGAAAGELRRRFAA